MMVSAYKPYNIYPKKITIQNSHSIITIQKSQRILILPPFSKELNALHTIYIHHTSNFCLWNCSSEFATSLKNTPIVFDDVTTRAMEVELRNNDLYMAGIYMQTFKIFILKYQRIQRFDIKPATQSFNAYK